MAPDGVYPAMNATTIDIAEGLGDERPGSIDDFAVYVRASERQHKRLAFLLTGDLNEAEDLLQAAYAKVYPRWQKVRAYDVPDAYLRRVMVSLRTSWWRRSRGRTFSVAEVPQQPSKAADPAGAVPERLDLLAALRELPDRQRVAVVLRHWCDLSEQQTAETMGCSIGTVKSNSSKGLAHLRHALGQPEGGYSS